MPTHAGKVDCIFIDPPYNTGSEDWSYNDNVNSPMIKKWLEDNPVGEDDTLRHDKWMSMMWPRIRLLHDLLAEGGTIWATIDQIELHRFRSLLEEIFGADNSIGVISWEKTYTPKSNSRIISEDTDYILGFAKGKARFEADGWNLIDKDETQLARYSNPDNDPKGPWRTFPLDVRTENEGKREKYRYPVTLPSGREVKPAAGRHWSLPQEVFESERAAGRIYFGVDGDAKPNVKAYLRDGRDKVIARTWWPYKDVGGNQDAKKQLLQIMGDDCDFITPKPETLIRRILDVATHPRSIVLDSFAGSGTTAHAVLKANEKDGSERRFILVEGEDYADRITAERVRRVIDGYIFAGTQREELLREKVTFSKLRKSAALLEMVQQIETLDGEKYDRIKSTVKDGALIVTGERDCEETAPGLGGTFTFCTLGEPIEMDKLLSGAHLPELQPLASLLYHTATSEAFDASQLKHVPDIGEHAYRLDSANGRHLWLFYKPDLDWLKSGEAALSLSNARAIAASMEGNHLVFAPAKFVSRELLNSQRIPVEYAPLPYALYRVETA